MKGEALNLNLKEPNNTETEAFANQPLFDGVPQVTRLPFENEA